jgi:hypothetical protein
MQSVRGLVAREPGVVARKHSPAMQQLAEELLQNENYDRVVCDFLTSTVNLPFGELPSFCLSTTWKPRYGAATASAAKMRCAGGTVVLPSQADRVRTFERSACAHPWAAPHVEESSYHRVRF